MKEIIGRRGWETLLHKNLTDYAIMETGERYRITEQI